MSRMFDFAFASPSLNTNIQKSRACTRKCTWLLRMRLPTPIRTRRWLGGRSRNSGNTSFGTISKALIAALKKGLKVRRDVDGKSLRIARSKLRRLTGAAEVGVAEVYDMSSPSRIDRRYSSGLGFRV